MDVVSFSRVGLSSSGVNVPGVPYAEFEAEVKGVGATPRISAISAADLDRMFLEATARARCLYSKSISDLELVEWKSKKLTRRHGK